MRISSKLECPDCGIRISRKNLSNHYRRMHPDLDPRERLKESRIERPRRRIEESPVPFMTVAIVAVFIVVILIVASLFLLSFIQDGESSIPEPKKAFFAANDGAIINGTFYPSGESGAYTVYLIHDIGGDRTVWKDTAIWLQEEGFNVMTIDLRGHGESTLNVKTPDITYDWKEMSGQEIKAVELDLRGAYDWVQGVDRDGNKNTDAGERGTMIGIGRGGLLAMNQASRMPREFISVTILSPILDVYEMDVEQLFQDYGSVRLVLLVASEDDTFSRIAIDRIMTTKEMDDEENGIGMIVPGNARGIDLLEYDLLKENILKTIEEGWELY